MENQNVFRDPPAQPENKAAQKTKFILPHCNTIRTGWDMLILAAALYVALPVPDDLTWRISASNVVVEILFVIDGIFNAYIAFVCKSGQVTFDGRQICIHYKNTCFTIDLLTVLAFDLLIAATASETSVVGCQLGYARLLRLVLLLVKTKRYLQRSSTTSILLMYAVDFCLMAFTFYIIVKMGNLRLRVCCVLRRLYKL